MPRKKLIKTKYIGVYYYEKEKKKIYVIKYKIDNIVKSKTLGSPPEWTPRVAYEYREKIIKEEKNGVKKSILLRDILDVAWEKYLDLRKPTLSQNWYKANRYYYYKHISPVLGRKRVSSIRKEDIQKIINSLLDKGYKPKTVKDLRDILRTFYNYVRKDSGDSSIYNPAEFVEIPKFDNKRVLQINLDEAKRLFRTIITYPNIKYRTIFIFLLHGRRKSEVLNMRWEYIDFNKNEYIIPYEFNKIRKNIPFPLTDILINALKDYGIKSEGYIFPNKFDEEKPASKGGGMDYHWKKIKALAGLEDEDIVIHDLRHLLGYISVNSGLPLEMIGKALGHQNIATTKRYSNVQVESAAKVLDNFFDKLNG